MFSLCGWLCWIPDSHKGCLEAVGCTQVLNAADFIKSFRSCSNCKEIAAWFLVKHLGRVCSCSVMPNGAFEHSPEYRCLRFGRGLLAFPGGCWCRRLWGDEAFRWGKISSLMMEMLIILNIFTIPSVWCWECWKPWAWPEWNSLPCS